MPLFASIASPGLTPLLVLGLSVVFIVVAIAVARIHAFFALMLAAVFVGLFGLPGAMSRDGLASSVELAMTEFGAAAGKIGFTIAIAAVIGAALMESGAADKIVRCLIAAVGESRAAFALLAAGFLLSVPIFFDTVFFLLVPIARALALRTGRNYVLYLLAICAGGVITHATVPPTPGPLAAAETLHVDLGLSILWGSAAGILPALGAFWFARWTNRRMPLPLRQTTDSTLDSLAAVVRRDVSELPGLAAAITPVLLPIALIAIASFAPAMASWFSPALLSLVVFLGNKNVALFLGAVIAIAVCLRQNRRGWRETSSLIGDPLATAGVIILITAAGGAYGAMIKNAGVAGVIANFVGPHSHAHLLIAWLLAAGLRIAQGSTTVAMITAAGIMVSLAGPHGFGIHPIYILLAIGYGALSLSWMNDSGFWIFSRMSGLTEAETLRSWTPLIAVISVLGLIELLILSQFFPANPATS